MAYDVISTRPAPSLCGMTRGGGSECGLRPPLEEGLASRQPSRLPAPVPASRTKLPSFRQSPDFQISQLPSWRQCKPSSCLASRSLARCRGQKAMNSVKPGLQMALLVTRSTDERSACNDDWRFSSRKVRDHLPVRAAETTALVANSKYLAESPQ
jgi:hypothetical protein